MQRSDQFQKQASLLGDAQWIAAPEVGNRQAGTPAPYFRREFSLDALPIAATLEVTALGLYECEINGQRVGDLVFAPGWTDYRHRLQVQHYDVTALLVEGENLLGAILGDGWYCGRIGARPRQFYGQRPQWVARLHGRLANGATFQLLTDESWSTRTGPILSNDLVDGEAYDARLELPGWSQPEDDGKGWGPVVVAERPDTVLVAAVQAAMVRRQEELRPVATWHDGSWRFDFGQNFSGRIRLSVKSSAGCELLLRHAEALTEEGHLYYENLRSALATDRYICRGGGESEVWEPRFTYHGFRYVEVSGLPESAELEVTGVVLHSTLPEIGHFACSHSGLNQLHQNIVWGLKSNFLEVPTDCPQRDERLGWTGDAQIFAETACFLRGMGPFFAKWLADLRAAQRPNGAIPPVIPDIQMPGDDGAPIEDGGPAWSDAVVICPWIAYLYYGDVALLREQYATMRRFIRFVIDHRTLHGIRSHPEVDPWGGFGDWLALESNGTLEGRTPRELIGTAYLAYDLEIMQKVAAILGDAEGAAEDRQRYHEVIEAFRLRFVTPDGHFKGDTQTGRVLALKLNLLPPEVARRTAEELVADIRSRGDHLSTGFVGTPWILEALAEYGHLDTAYRLLEQEEYPSWLFPVRHGATTIWERWDGWTPEHGFQDPRMNSFNHYAYGAVGAWMVKTAAGINPDPEQPAFRHTHFRPRPGGSLLWAEAHHDSPYGRVAIRWERKAEEWCFDLEVPPGCRATFHLPAEISEAKALPLSSGRHRLCFNLRNPAEGNDERAPLSRSV